MSMIGHFLLVSDFEVARLLAKPETVHDVIDAAYEQRTADFVDVDKTWHSLHFLLTGTAWEGEPPLDFVAIGGHEVGEEDVGYGPARAFTSAEVKAIARALEPIDAAELARRFDGQRMDELEIYPGRGWTKIDPNSEESFGYTSGAFDSLRNLVRRGSSEGRGLVVWLS
jgi:hypothetical protein